MYAFRTAIGKVQLECLKKNETEKVCKKWQPGYFEGIGIIGKINKNHEHKNTIINEYRQN